MGVFKLEKKRLIKSNLKIKYLQLYVDLKQSVSSHSFYLQAQLMSHFPHQLIHFYGKCLTILIHEDGF